VEELMQFLEAVTVPRYRAMLTTMYAGGLRLGETLHLRVEDIDSARMVIHVRKGKGKKDRYVPLSPIVLDLLRAHWRSEKPRGLLFPNAVDPERPMSDGSVQRYVHNTARRAGLTKRVTPHTLRHSYATHLMEQGTSTRVIQVLLGHAHVRTTEAYMHVSPQSLRDATSPIDRLLPSRNHD
jgi:integrase/recombinase XerD